MGVASGFGSHPLPQAEFPIKRRERSKANSWGLGANRFVFCMAHGLDRPLYQALTMIQLACRNAFFLFALETQVEFCSFLWKSCFLLTFGFPRKDTRFDLVRQLSFGKCLWITTGRYKQQKHQYMLLEDSHLLLRLGYGPLFRAVRR